MVIISAICTAMAFSFGNLALIEPDSFGAKFFYAFMVVLLYAFDPGSYGVYPPALDQAFGPKYSAHNYGLIFESGVSSPNNDFRAILNCILFQLIYCPLLIILTQLVADDIGFIGMFYICGIAGLLCKSKSEQLTLPLP